MWSSLMCSVLGYFNKYLARKLGVMPLPLWKVANISEWPQWFESLFFMSVSYNLPSLYPHWVVCWILTQRAACNTLVPLPHPLTPFLESLPAMFSSEFYHGQTWTRYNRVRFWGRPTLLKGTCNSLARSLACSEWMSWPRVLIFPWTIQVL